MKKCRAKRSVSLMLMLVSAVTPCVYAAEDTTPPLPFHTTEGYGGGAITPIAYLVNPTPVNGKFGRPAFALTQVGLGQKNMTSISATETIGGKLELGFAAERLGLGTLPGNIQTATGVNILKSNIWLYNLNARYQAVTEKKGRPAVTVGAHFKYNSDIDAIDNRLGGALTGIGLRDNSGLDFTLTATKMFADVGGHPLIVSGGLRESKAAHVGFLGFAKNYKTTFEGNLVYLPAKKVVVAYEIRQKSSPYGQIPGLIGGENTWHAVDASYILNNRSTIVAGYGRFGTMADAKANSAWWLQFKNEF